MTRTTAGLLCQPRPVYCPYKWAPLGVLCSTLVQIPSGMRPMFDDVCNVENRDLYHQRCVIGGWFDLISFHFKCACCCSNFQQRDSHCGDRFLWWVFHCKFGTLSNIVYMSGFPGQSGPQLGRGRYSTQNCTKSDKYYLLFCTCYYRITELAVVAI